MSKQQNKGRKGRKLDANQLQQVFDLVRANSETLSRGKGAELLNMSRPTFNRYFGKLEEQGRVKLNNKGHMVVSV